MIMNSSDSTPESFREAWGKNIAQYLQETSLLRNDSVLNTRETLLRIILNDANMNKVPKIWIHVIYIDRYW